MCYNFAAPPCIRSERASHLYSTVHVDATPFPFMWMPLLSRVVLTLARDKGTSTNVWAGCEAIDQRGPLPIHKLPFMTTTRSRGFLVPELLLEGPADPLEGDARLKGRCHTQQ